MHNTVIAIAIVIVGILWIPSPALAHGDVRLVDEIITLAPGEHARFDGELHYHRLVGDIQASGPVKVTLVGPGDEEPVFAAGPGVAIAFNELIRCCDDRVWAQHHFVIENASNTPVTVQAAAILVHDDLAVMVYGTESGTRQAIVVMGAIWSVVLWRGSRRRRSSRLPFSRSVAAFGLLAATVGPLAWYGAYRYETGGAPALIAALGNIPVVPVNPVVSRASLVMFIAIAGWGLAGYWWARASASTGTMAWIALGLGLAAASVLTAVLIASAYGSAAVPVAMAVLAVAPILVVIGRDLMKRSRREAQLA